MALRLENTNTPKSLLTYSCKQFTEDLDPEAFYVMGYPWTCIRDLN